MGLHIEAQWAESCRTVDGALLHQRVHDQELRESRGDLLVVRGLAVHSARLGVTGRCDAVELRRSPRGVPLSGREGLWLPYPVEYKRGRPKDCGADELQLCAQAICLEEMLCCAIPEGALYYGEPRRRTVVALSPELRQRVSDCLAEMHRLYRRQYTPRVRPTKACSACSLKELCLPKSLFKISPHAALTSLFPADEEPPAAVVRWTHLRVQSAPLRYCARRRVQMQPAKPALSIWKKSPPILRSRRARRGVAPVRAGALGEFE